MNKLAVADFYPKRFSLWLDAFVWLAVFLGGLAFASDTIAGQWLPARVWFYGSLFIYLVVGFVYGSRQYPMTGEEERVYNWVWIGYINIALPVFLTTTIATLLWLAGAITFMTASWLAIGALFFAVAGPVLAVVGVLVLALIIIWKESRAKSA